MGVRRVMPRLMKLVLAVKPFEGCWIGVLKKRFKDVSISLIESNHGVDEVRQLFEIVTPKDTREVAEFLRDLKQLDELQITELGQGRIYGSARAKCASGCPVFNSSCCFLRKVITSVNGEAHYHFIGSDVECKRLMRNLADRGVVYRVEELRFLRGRSSLTGKQELVVKVAFDLGYFDYPKKISVREMAEIFEVSPATINEEIRKGVKKILKEYFEVVKEAAVV